jgi:hypothetical protein
MPAGQPSRRVTTHPPIVAGTKLVFCHLRLYRVREAYNWPVWRAVALEDGWRDEAAAVSSEHISDGFVQLTAPGRANLCRKSVSVSMSNAVVDVGYPMLTPRTSSTPQLKSTLRSWILAGVSDILERLRHGYVRCGCCLHKRASQ